MILEETGRRAFLQHSDEVVEQAMTVAQLLNGRRLQHVGFHGTGSWEFPNLASFLL